jgi:hypothetical protein
LTRRGVTFAKSFKAPQLKALLKIHRIYTPPQMASIDKERTSEITPKETQTQNAEAIITANPDSTIDNVSNLS